MSIISVNKMLQRDVKDQRLNCFFKSYTDQQKFRVFHLIWSQAIPTTFLRGSGLF